uniref:Uncharacterized protein n=1 Tax=Arundo donax TaxID=35708 RepID=A0A0A9EQZ2_ARUDO
MLCSAKGFSREMHASHTRGVRRKQCSSQLLQLGQQKQQIPTTQKITRDLALHTWLNRHTKQHMQQHLPHGQSEKTTTKNR